MRNSYRMSVENLKVIGQLSNVHLERVWTEFTSVMVGYNSELLGELLSKKINIF